MEFFLEGAHPQNSFGHLTAVGAPWIGIDNWEHYKMTQRNLSKASLLAAVGALLLQ